MPFEERMAIFSNIVGVEKVVEQKELSYAENLRAFRPDYVAHGDDWKEGFQKPIRQEVQEILSEYGGRLVEFPYSNASKYKKLEALSRAELSMPDIRRARLKKL